MNHSEWQKVHQEETEWALLNIMRLSEEKRIQWKLENFSPAELMQGETANWGYLVQRFEASTFWAGYELSFSSCAMIHVPSGKGNIIIAFVYKNGMSTYFSSLANDEGYEEASTEDLLEIYGGSLIVKGSEIIWDAVKNDANAYIVQEDDIACFQYLPSRMRTPA